MKSLKEIGVNMQKHALEAEKNAIKIMKKHGLTVNQVPPQLKQEWETIFHKAIKNSMGKAVHEESYNLVLKYIDEYRKMKGK